jgi:hypothetical protein
MLTETKVEKVLGSVKTKEEAKEVISALLDKFTSQTAKQRIESQARFSKQTSRETTKRAVNNLLTHFKTRHPYNYWY